MLTPPRVKHPSRRRRRRRRNEAAATPPPPAGLALVAIEGLAIIGPELEMNLQFDVAGTDLLNDVSAADPAKWTARYQGQTFVGSILQNIAPDMLYLQMQPAGAQAGPDVLNYANAPSDVSDSLGRQLAAFVAFPLPSS